MQDTGFDVFLNRTREEREIPREALRDGLCSESELGKIENGKRFPDKPMRDRLLARLGERGYEYENFLQLEEYMDWRERDNILELLESGRAGQAEKLLEEYALRIAADDKVSRQFYLAMKLQLLELGQGMQGKKELYLREAVFLTIPWETGKTLKEMVLSIEELNLVLEYNSYMRPVNEEECYLELLGYIKQERFDEECRAMLIPKVAYYYCCYLWEKLTCCRGKAERQQLAELALKISGEGIDNLRNNERTYFAWELLQKEAEFLQLLLSEGKLTTEECTKYVERKNWNQDIFLVLDDLYEDVGVQKRTCAYTYFYREYEIYCINDVLRARRKMLGYKKRDFEENGVCTYRTVCRIERGESGVQRNIARHMMRKMNLSVSFQRAQIVTDSKQALRLEKKYRNAMNQREYQEAELLLQQVKKLIPMNLLINQQYIAQNECDLEYYLGRITKEEYAKGLQQALELTVPLEVAMQPIRDKRLNNGFIQSGEKYLTNTEISILKTLSVLYGDKDNNPYPPMLLEYYRQFEQQGGVSHMISMREFVMAYLDGYYGNIGEYDESDRLIEQSLYDELRLRRLGRAAHFLYSQMWNDEQRKKKNLPVRKESDRQACFKQCIALTGFCKNEFLNQWMKNKQLQ